MSNSDHKIPLVKNDGFWPHFLDPFKDMGASISNFFAPTVDALHSNNYYEINVEIPGVAESDIDIALEDGFLTIKGEKKSQHEEKEKNYYISERRYGSFMRKFRLPPDVIDKDISASIDKGVLAIRLPRKYSEETEKRKIDISIR